MGDYRKLIVWQKGKDLCILIYRLTELLPQSERFGLVSQMRRAVVSIPSNIAEGSRRRGEAEQRQFFCIAYGSTAELETQIEIAKSLFPEISDQATEAEKLLDEVARMLNVLTIKSKNN